MQKWEYKILKNTGFIFNADEMKEKLDPYGAEGWEVCGCYLDPKLGEVVIMKRPLE